MNQAEHDTAPSVRPHIRLYVPTAFTRGQYHVLGQNPSHYLAHVMRVHETDTIAVFNGADGEWLADIFAVAKKTVTLQFRMPIAAQKNSPDLWLAFAPIKSKGDIVVEKAVELGVSTLFAVYTRHAVVKSINMEKLMAHAVEAAEQSGRHDVPHIEEYKDLPMLLGKWPKERTLLYADESGGGESLKNLLPTLPAGKYGILVGPEGGFSAEEHRLLKLTPFVRAFGMGPRILRADTASVAALACVQAWLGDWEEQPHFEAEAHG
jgi:16S rRNA (uracil1498-N3)-methyltransferase